MKKSFIYIAALTLIAACNKVESPAPSQGTDIITAQIEQVAATKTYMDANNNIRWSEGDHVVAFMKSSYGHKYQLISSFAGKTYADFSIVSSGNGNLSAGTEWDHNVVYYPYSDAIQAAKSGSNYVLDVVLPSEQTYAAESFGNGSMAMVAVSEDNNITFRNVLGGMKLLLRGPQKVKSITLQGNNNEKLSGAATVTAYADETKPAITMASGASTSVTLNCGAGVQLNESKATEFIIALPPVLFSKGFKVTVTDADSKTYTTDTDKTNTVLRSSLLVMPELEIGDTAAQNGDYVDEYGINHGQGVKIGETVWAPVNCGYHATDYAYGKLYQWGRKYGQGYSGNLYGINGNNTGTISDSTVPTLSEGGVSEIGGNHKSNANVFYYGSSDWVDPRNDMLWNLGSESNPAKTDYDPCPKGWRIPTYAELAELCQNHSSWTSKDGQNGCWFSGASSYTEGISQVFFPAAGWRDYYSGNALTRGNCGTYLSSRPTSYGYAYHLRLRSGNIEMNNNRRANGYSVRCVQE